MLELKRRLRRGRFLPCAAALCGILAAGCGQGEDAGNLRLLAGSEDILHRVLETEDSRAQDPAAHFTLLEGISWPDPEVQRIAVRALGRQQNPSVLVDIGSMLESPYADVRAEAVNAIAQAVAGGEPRRAMLTLMNYLPHEREPEVRGAVLEAMGRLPYQNPDEVGQVYDLLLRNLVAGLAGSSVPLLLKRFGMDPAVSSAVFVTTFTDVLGFLIFLGMAALLIERLA